MAMYSNTVLSAVVLIALFVRLIPTTIAGLLSTIGISGMDRLLKFNVVALSGRAVGSSGNIDLLLLDKTGTITLGNRFATDFIALGATSPDELAHAAWISSLVDETPEGKSIVKLAEQRFRFKQSSIDISEAEIIPFSAYTRMSGINYQSLGALNFMGLHSSTSAILSAVIFNALIIIFLIPMALVGVKNVVASSQTLLRRNLLYYGLGGVIVPFIAIKLIDMLITAMHMV